MRPFPPAEFDPDEVLQRMVEHPELYDIDHDPGAKELIDQLLDMKLAEVAERNQALARAWTEGYEACQDAGRNPAHQPANPYREASHDQH